MPESVSVAQSKAERGSRLRVIVGGFLGLLPAGGITWDYIQYPLGFASLGHDVFYIEDTRLWPVYQQSTPDELACARNVEHLARVMAAFGLVLGLVDPI